MYSLWDYIPESVWSCVAAVYIAVVGKLHYKNKIVDLANYLGTKTAWLSFLCTNVVLVKTFCGKLVKYQLPPRICLQHKICIVAKIGMEL